MSNDINEALGVSSSSQQPGPPSLRGKYASLKKIADLFAIFAWVSGGVVVLIGIVLLTAKTGIPAGLAILLFLFYLYLGILVVISFLAQAGIIKVLVDIEENTRK